MHDVPKDKVYLSRWDGVESRYSGSYNDSVDIGGVCTPAIKPKKQASPRLLHGFNDLTLWIMSFRAPTFEKLYYENKFSMSIHIEYIITKLRAA